jgi:hypothetical protein
MWCLRLCGNSPANVVKRCLSTNGTTLDAITPEEFGAAFRRWQPTMRRIGPEEVADVVLEAVRQQSGKCGRPSAPIIELPARRLAWAPPDAMPRYRPVVRLPPRTGVLPACDNQALDAQREPLARKASELLIQLRSAAGHRRAYARRTSSSPMSSARDVISSSPEPGFSCHLTHASSGKDTGGSPE